MSVRSHLNQSATWYPLTALDFHHAPAWGDAEPVKVRWQDRAVVVPTSPGEAAGWSTIVYCEPVALKVGDRLDYGGVSYRVGDIGTNRDHGGSAQMLKVTVELL